MLYLPVGIVVIGIRSPSRRSEAEYGWSHSMSRPLLDSLVARTKSDESLKNEITCCSDDGSNKCLTFASVNGAFT
ncbi:hypothetical protein GJ496_010067 [Pomphorhynchus laevis]|nr:hypothetical protein GJ496_010067 [Pomphorhynchus laevis]